jgi:hypothetical protein
MMVITEPGGASRWLVQDGVDGVVGGSSAGGQSVKAVDLLDVMSVMVSGGSGIDEAGAIVVAWSMVVVVWCTAGVLGIWSNRTHPVEPYPSHLPTGLETGQHSQSIARSRNSGVILFMSQ